MNLLPLPMPLAPALHERVSTWLDTACARPGCDITAADLLALCAARQAQMIGAFDGEDLVAVGVTQVRRNAGDRLSCWVLSLAGRAAGPWSAVIAAVERGAGHLGCRTVEFVGRRGWSRVLPGYTAVPCEAGLHFTKSLERTR